MKTIEARKLTKDISLLTLSALKWQRIAFRESSDDAIDDCALCHEYYVGGTQKYLSCAGCPIKEKTGKQFCIGSPYEDWSIYLDADSTELENTVFDGRSKILALEMLIFLLELQEELSDRAEQLESAINVSPNLPSTTEAVYL